MCFSTGVFLIPYIIMLFLAGMPLFFLETAFGQYASQGPVTIWKACPLFTGKHLFPLSWLILFLLFIYYCCSSSCPPDHVLLVVFVKLLFFFYLLNTYCVQYYLDWFFAIPLFDVLVFGEINNNNKQTNISVHSCILTDAHILLRNV